MLKVIKRLLGIKKVEWVKELGICTGILMGDYDGVKTYYNSGHDVNKHLEGNTPLGLAALNGHKDLVELLINFGADPNCLDEELKSTPLHWIMCFKLENDDERCKNKEFKQSHAIREIVTILMNKRGNINALTSDGETPLDYFNAQVIHRQLNPMADEDIDGLFKLLRKHGAKTSEELKAEEN